MEPGRLRENPLGSGAPEAPGWRELRPAGEAQEAGGAMKAHREDRCTVQPEPGARAKEPSRTDKNGTEEDEEDEQYEEEELDPRIQVCMCYFSPGRCCDAVSFLIYFCNLLDLVTEITG